MRLSAFFTMHMAGAAVQGMLKYPECNSQLPLPSLVTSAW